MPEKIRFSKKDIGGEILPILTTGLYKNILDTLREYIQNSIDAMCSQIQLIIDPDTITVFDDGVGMSFDEARMAIRLGISEKSPVKNVGFRGIGIYSAFNLCQSLDIYTRSADSPNCYVIQFNFKKIRESLLMDQEQRKLGEPSTLYLEKLLEENVSVGIDENDTLTESGTKCIMSEPLDYVYQSMNTWDEVVTYLQHVVPLPFHPDFKYIDLLEEKFQREDYKVVPLHLQIGNQKGFVFRPYNNKMFTLHGEHPPEFFEIKDKKDRYGFAWVCINDARRVFKDLQLRGLLIKKYGFSISNRNLFEQYFGRGVVNRRITGEVIVQHKNLIPNAARSDFEHNSTRQAFYQTFPKLIKSISEWANRIQEEDKAKEVLAELAEKVVEINRELPESRRNREKLLQFNIELHDLAAQLKRHSKIIKRIMLNEYNEMNSLVKECQQFVKSSLSEKKKAQKKVEKQIVRTIQHDAAARKKAKDDRLKDIPRNFVGLIEAYGLQISKELMGLLKFLDENILQIRFPTDDYNEVISELRDFLEDRD